MRMSYHGELVRRELLIQWMNIRRLAFILQEDVDAAAKRHLVMPESG